MWCSVVWWSVVWCWCGVVWCGVSMIITICQWSSPSCEWSWFRSKTLELLLTAAIYYDCSYKLLYHGHEHYHQKWMMDIAIITIMISHTISGACIVIATMCFLCCLRQGEDIFLNVSRMYKHASAKHLQAYTMLLSNSPSKHQFKRQSLTPALPKALLLAGDRCAAWSSWCRAIWKG